MRTRVTSLSVSLSVSLRMGLGLAASFIACSPSQEQAPAEATASRDDGRISVYVVSYPLAYLAERIGGESVDVTFPAPLDIDPAHWSPEPEQVAAYQAADLILRNGAGYSTWIDRSSFSRRKLIDTSVGFQDRLLPLNQTVIHTHGPDGNRSHSGVASTTWLDPTLALEHARSIAEALSQSRPQEREVFARNLERLESDLVGLDQRLEEIAEPLGRVPIIFSHPVYQYLERRYGLNGRSLHWEPEEIPDAEMWLELEKLLAQHPARLMIWEAAPHAETRHRLEVLGLTTAVYAPCSHEPESGSWLDVMESNIEGLEAFLLEDVHPD